MDFGGVRHEHKVKQAGDNVKVAAYYEVHSGRSQKILSSQAEVHLRGLRAIKEKVPAVR